MNECSCKILTRIGIFIIIFIAIFFTFVEISSRREIDAKLYIIQLLIENKPKLENEELGVKVSEIYNLISGK